MFGIYTPGVAVTPGLYGFRVQLQVFDATADRLMLTSSTFSGNWEVTISPVPEPVTIDIKPGSDLNSIDLRTEEEVAVAILSTNTGDGDAIDFDALQVNPLTVKFGRNSAVEKHGQGHVEDIDGDGDLDLVLHFDIQETGIVCVDTEASLTGETFDGRNIVGTDSVNVLCICDVDYDDDVDMNDIYIISLHRNQPATGPDDPMDWDKNGVINILDARGCQRACTLPRCAVQ